MSLKPGEYEHVVTEEALDDEGYVLSIEAGLTTIDGNVKKATGTYYEVHGINIKGSEDPTVPGTYIADVEVAIARDGIRKVQVAAHAGRTTAIAIGDTVAVLDVGKIAHLTDCPCKIGDTSGSDVSDAVEKFHKCIVGTAREACAAGVDPTDGKISVRLTPR